MRSKSYCHKCRESIIAEDDKKEDKAFFFKHFRHGKFSSVMLDDPETTEQALIHGVPL